jgi:hypothetical protein
VYLYIFFIAKRAPPWIGVYILYENKIYTGFVGGEGLTRYNKLGIYATPLIYE